VSFGRLFQRSELLVLLLLLLAPALSFFWSDDKAYWLRLVQTRLPFLVLPWAFANLPTLTERQWKSVLYLLVWFMVGLCIAIGINFLWHFDTIIEGLGRGNPIPVPRSHVRFSLILSTAIISGGWLWQQGFWLRRAWERRALLAAVAFLFVFLHVLSVRSGLFSLYAALLFALLRYVWISKRWLASLAALGLLAAGLWVATETVPSLKMRIAYMKYDWDRFNTKDDGYLYSDAVRWGLIAIWLESLAAKSSPWYRRWGFAPRNQTHHGRDVPELFTRATIAAQPVHFHSGQHRAFGACTKSRRLLLANLLWSEKPVVFWHSRSWLLLRFL
jgi:hypothetical protein